MPYCPKCDMEFVPGITKCSDCGGPLVESQEAWEAQQKQMEEELFAGQKQEWKKIRPSGSAEAVNDSSVKVINQQDVPQRSRTVDNGHAFVKKSQKYDDLKSSAFAFLLVGAIIAAASVCGWAGILPIPMTGFGRYLMLGITTVFAVGCFVIAYRSMQSAEAVKGQVAEEDEATEKLIEWFVTNYSAQDMDRRIVRAFGSMVPEEMSLKRYGLIQDIIVTNHDITDQSYLDVLVEDIYNKLYED